MRKALIRKTPVELYNSRPVNVGAGEAFGFSGQDPV